MDLHAFIGGTHLGYKVIHTEPLNWLPAIGLSPSDQGWTSSPARKVMNPREVET